MRKQTSTICCAHRFQRDSVKDSVAHAVELSVRPRREVYCPRARARKKSGRHGEN